MPVYLNDSSLVSLWLFENGANLGLDYKNANNLTDNNTVATSADAQEGVQSADFERANSESLSIADGSQVGLDITGNITIGGWIKPESIPIIKFCTKWLTTGNQRSYTCGTGGTLGDIELILSADGTAAVGCLTPTGVVAAGVWAHVAFVYNGTDIRAYVDGALASNGASNPKAYTGGIFGNSTATFRLGGQDNSTNYHDGLMDEWAVLNRALSATEVSDWFTYGILPVGGLVNSPRRKSLTGRALVR